MSSGSEDPGSWVDIDYKSYCVLFLGYVSFISWNMCIYSVTKAAILSGLYNFALIMTKFFKKYSQLIL